MTPRDLADRLIGPRPAGAATYPVIAPFTGEEAFALPLSSESEVDAAFASARRAQAAWAATSVRDRCRIVLRFHDLAGGR